MLNPNVYPDPTHGLGWALIWTAILLLIAAVCLAMFLKTFKAFWTVVPILTAGLWLNFGFSPTINLTDCFERLGVGLIITLSITASFAAAYPRQDNYRSVIWHQKWHKCFCITTIVCLVISIVGIFAQGKF